MSAGSGPGRISGQEAAAMIFAELVACNGLLVKLALSRGFLTATDLAVCLEKAEDLRAHLAELLEPSSPGPT